ncbi:MAG: hypothetical protein ACK5XZ_11240 [Hyphomonadaceae bacterium]|uniref:hypothetical protein n=1 Tax=Aquidulcibacter sp. TaxID=2052990 RepID=UPI0022C060F7|nr:hypothetical protein [Aquidulcibacter sp.]MCZ8207340.1 hypothetical protein [Aquidulcibacter sp.]
MRTKELGPIVISDLGHSRPHFWTIATVGTVHLVLSALLLTSTGPILESNFLDNVEIVTLPQSSDATQAPVPVQPTPAPAIPSSAPPEQSVEPPLEAMQPPAPAAEATIPPPVAPPPAPTKQVAPETPKAPPVLAQANNPKPVAAPVPVEEVAPIPFKPIAAPLPKPVTLRPAAPTLTQPTPEALQIKGQRLKANTAPTVQANPNLRVPDAVKEDEPAPYQPAPLPSLAPAAAPNLRTLPNRPITATPTQAAPLALPKSQIALPKVQVPQIKASDLRVPDQQAVADASGGNAAAAGGSAGGGATSQATAQTGAGTAGGVTSLGGSFAGGGAAPTASGGSSNGGQTAAGSGAPTGILPRRPGGAGVKTEFPTGVGGNLLSKMARTGECAQINRQRDGKCPDWDPIDGRNPREQKPIPVAVPKDAAPGRYPLGTNPLPLCKPGTPQAQFGLSCLPRDDGPGIPKQ